MNEQYNDYHTLYRFLRTMRALIGAQRWPYPQDEQPVTYVVTNRSSIGFNVHFTQPLPDTNYSVQVQVIKR